MTISDTLSSIETTQSSSRERAYFLIHEARYKKILKELDSRLRGNDKARILDVGCYPYHLGSALEKMGHDVWGISSEHEPIKNKRVAILNIETDAFPYKDNTFDIILCSEVLELLPHSPMPAIREMYRVAKPGGSVLITTPNIAGSIHSLYTLFGKTLPTQKQTENIYHRHNHEYTLPELSGIIKKSGWIIEKSMYVIGYPPFRKRNKTDNPLLWSGKFANFLAMSAVPRLRDTLLIIGKK